MTLVIVADEDDADEAHERRPGPPRASTPPGSSASILGDGRGAAQVDAQVGIGAGGVRRDAR